MINNEAIEILKSWDGCIFLEREEDSVGYSYNKEISQEAIAFAIKVLEERQDRWIPVSERLPEQGNQSYLVTVDYGEGLVCSCQRFFFNEDIGWNDDCVIAWQSLPEPYKVGSEKE